MLKLFPAKELIGCFARSSNRLIAKTKPIGSEKRVSEMCKEELASLEGWPEAPCSFLGWKYLWLSGLFLNGEKSYGLNEMFLLRAVSARGSRSPQEESHATCSLEYCYRNERKMNLDQGGKSRHSLSSDEAFQRRY